MFVTGEQGCVQLRRRTGITVDSVVRPEDINTLINRFGFEGAEDNLIQADRIEISTDDPRGLVFIDPSWWPDNTIHHSAMVYAHINAMGGVRMFHSFEDAINNDKQKAGKVIDFTGNPIAVRVDVRDTGHHRLGGVRRFTFNTDRAAVDTTSLGDLFTEQFSAGNITGSGTIDCYFQVERGLCGETASKDNELSILLPQIILRTELGGQFDAILQLADAGDGKPVFYEITAIATRTGIEVDPTGVVAVALDFVTSGEFRLRIGEPSGYILKEDYDRIMREQDIDFLLTEPTD
jgi:hypothetical protein